MVTTRSSDHKNDVSATPDKMKSGELDNQKPHVLRQRNTNQSSEMENDLQNSAKRSLQADEDTPATKRRRPNWKGKKETAPAEEANEEDAGAESDNKHAIGGDVMGTPGQEGEYSIYETPATRPQSSVYATPATHLAKPGSSATATPPASHIPKNRSQKGTKSKSGAQNSILSTAKKANAFVPTPKATHIRFDSEESESLPPTNADPHEPLLNNDNEEEPESESEDDEAPEAITNASAIQSARTFDAGASRAVAAQRAATRTKRKDRDTVLKSQAKEAGNKGRKRRQQEEEEDDSDVEEIPRTDLDDDAQTAYISLSSIPNLLPQELLDAAPEVRPLSPPPLALSTTTSKPDKLDLLNPKRPKDVKRGPVKVRVLQDSNPLLAPKADRKTGTVREARETWMMGRAGTGGKMKGVVGTGKMERRAVGSASGKGFLRK
ncbi:hypothetical protein NA57DRAFT_54328 [Rhizodiscina lignyota]|uniref:Uncharacterized protein n=1 Tax=Rhizodiscina lignyota TaxID=1504668 RepID=A0A9P4IJ68_9PEZI|nr:hypothetical protein NA57DRAFT_54328 [Rhizodiscina lignyota]